MLIWSLDEAAYEYYHHHDGLDLFVRQLPLSPEGDSTDRRTAKYRQAKEKVHEERCCKKEQMLNERYRPRIQKSNSS